MTAFSQPLISIDLDLFFIFGENFLSKCQFFEISFNDLYTPICKPAGLQIGVYKSLKDISKNWHLDKKFSPKMKNKSRSMLIKGWEKAVKRALIN